MNNKEVAKRINVVPATISEWKHSRPELVKLIEIGVKVEENLEKIQEFIQKQKELLGIETVDIDLKETKIKQVEIARRINASPNTIVNWGKTKPELIKLLNLAIASEIHIKELDKYLLNIEENL